MPHKQTHRPVTIEMPAWGVVVFESHHASGFRMGVSRHEWLETFYVLHGKGVFELDGHRVECIAGDVLVVPPGCSHRILDDPTHPLSLYCARIRKDVWKGCDEIGPRLPTGRMVRNRMVSRQVRSEFRWLLFEQTRRRVGCAAMMVGSALQILALIVRGQTKLSSPTHADAAPISSLQQAVESYVSELEHEFFKPVSLDDVARELGMSRRRFTELFRKITGTSWTQRVRTLRIEHARQLLRTTGRSVAAIAFESGFEELSSFYRAFHRETGVSPLQFRQRKEKTRT